jgi:hypothetical protein
MNNQTVAYTLQQINDIMVSKNYLTMDRFVHYFTTRYSFSNKSAEAAFKKYITFPWGYRPNNLEEIELTNLILGYVIELYHSISAGVNIRPENIGWNAAKDLRKLIYTESGESKELVIDFNDSNDIITYAELIRRQVKIIALLNCSCETSKDKTYIPVFEGDFFNTYDEYYGNKSNVYLATKEKGVFKRLLYIKDKGYLLKGKPNIDEGSFNSHVLSMQNWIKMGNIYTDLHLLADTEDK